MIKVSNLSKTFGDNLIFSDISFTIEKGEIVVIIGPSGTGKSTLLRCMNYLETPTSGQITIDQLSVDAAHHNSKEVLELRKKTAFVFQNYALFANKTARDNIAEGLITVRKVPKDEARRKAEQVLQDIGLEDKFDAYPSSLSGGQQQRVGIGRAMAAGSEVILFDEPTSALDPEWVDEVLGLMKKLANKHQTMVIVTHEMQFAKEIADKIMFLSDGKIVEQGHPDQIFTNPKDPRTRKFLAKVLPQPLSEGSEAV